MWSDCAAWGRADTVIVGAAKHGATLAGPICALSCHSAQCSTEEPSAVADDPARQVQRDVSFDKKKHRFATISKLKVTVPLFVVFVYQNV